MIILVVSFQTVSKQNRNKDPAEADSFGRMTEGIVHFGESKLWKDG